MNVVAQTATAYALGAALAAALWAATRGVFDADVFRRTNYRGHELPTSAGLLVPLAAGALVAVAQPGAEGPWWSDLAVVGRPVALAAFGVSFLGLVDDLGGVGESGGFRGHLRALSRGRVTTGALKLIGVPVVAVVVLPAFAGWSDLVREVVLVSLAANLANLLDRAPGRVAKVGTASFVAMVAATRAPAMVPVGAVMGAVAGLASHDLRERLMLGDAGSNVIGAVLGLAVTVVATPLQQWIVLGVLLAANLVSEVVSFSRVIDATPPLRWLDRLGAPHRP